MRLAITGGPGEGKSTVLQIIAAQGLPVASADVVARQVFDLPESQERIAQHLGLALPIDRQALRDLVLHDAAARRKLNAIMHPRTIAALRATGAHAVEVPLLVEACLLREFDRVWVVTCSAQEQLRRLELRLGSASAARDLIAAQLPTDVKSAFADRIVRTDRELSRVRRFVLNTLAEEPGLTVANDGNKCYTRTDTD